MVVRRRKGQEIHCLLFLWERLREQPLPGYSGAVLFFNRLQIRITDAQLASEEVALRNWNTKFNELEALIRDKLPDPVRRHLIDVIIDRTDADGLTANWTAQAVWGH